VLPPGLEPIKRGFWSHCTGYFRRFFDFL